VGREKCIRFESAVDGVDAPTLMPRREVILTTLANRDADYGGVEGYLSWAGVPRAVIDGVGCRFVDYPSLRK
jgi:hypothetical protein